MLDKLQSMGISNYTLIFSLLFSLFVYVRLTHYIFSVYGSASDIWNLAIFFIEVFQFLFFIFYKSIELYISLFTLSLFDYLCYTLLIFEFILLLGYSSYLLINIKLYFKRNMYIYEFLAQILFISSELLTFYYSLENFYLIIFMKASRLILTFSTVYHSIENNYQ